jgi:hypothetical protein
LAEAAAQQALMAFIQAALLTARLLLVWPVVLAALHQ